MSDTHGGTPRKRRIPLVLVVPLFIAVLVVSFAATYLTVRPSSHPAPAAPTTQVAPQRSAAASPSSTPVVPALSSSFAKCFGIAAGSGTASVPLRYVEKEILFAFHHHCWWRLDFEMRYEQPQEPPKTAYWLPGGIVLNPAQQVLSDFIKHLDRGVPAIDQLHVIGIVDNVPGWANPEVGNQCNNGPVLCAPDANHIDAYGQFGGDVASNLYHVTDNVALEPGNEVNSAFSFEPTPSPAIYVAMLRAITKYVNLLPHYQKFVHTHTPVIFSGLSPAQNPGQSPLTKRTYRFIDPATFVAEAYAAGAKPYFTAMGMHVGMNGLTQVKSVYGIMQQKGDAAKPVVITEFDVVTDPTHEAPGTTSYIASIRNQWFTLPWLKSILIYAPPGDGADNSLYTTTMEAKTAIFSALYPAW